MKNKTQSLQETIRAQAYLLSEKAGHPPGLEDFFWFQAEAMVLERAVASTNGHVPSAKNSRKAETKRGESRVPASIQGGKSDGRKVLATR